MYKTGSLRDFLRFITVLPNGIIVDSQSAPIWYNEKS